VNLTAEARPSRRWTVYLMSDPRPGGLTYVGCTVGLLAVRLSQHVSWVAAHPVQIWVEVLRRAGCEPTIETLFVADDERTGLALERSTIKSMCDSGVRLLNTRHAKSPTHVSVGHLQLWASCDRNYRTFCERHGHDRGIWLGHCPSIHDAMKLEKEPGIRIRDWLTYLEAA
jgi:hypothetical protein